MSISLNEVLRLLNKLVGKYEREMGLRVFPTARDHVFIPELDVDDTGVSLSVSGFIYKVKVIGDYPVYLNIDRPVGDEYTIVFPGSYYIIPRIGKTLYLKAPTGFRTKVRIETLAL
jgi:hypothetical protein